MRQNLLRRLYAVLCRAGIRNPAQPAWEIFNDL
jgi:hypothetical protein